jgi:hypothetical protein
MKKPGSYGWNSIPQHYHTNVIQQITAPAVDDKQFDNLADVRRMRKDGGKFRPKHTMPGIVGCVIHTEHPGLSAD